MKPTSPSAQSQEFEGEVQGHRDGYGFVLLGPDAPDVVLPVQEMRTVLHGDRVRVRVVGMDRRGKPEGRVLEILERRRRPIIGRLLCEGGVWLVAPEDRRFTQDVLIPPSGIAQATAGQVVAVELTEPPSLHSQPVGRVTEVLGEIDDPGMEIEIAVRKYEVPYQFSAAALAQSEGLPSAVRPVDRRGRVDLRDVGLVTIDGEDARDFDDAVYCEPCSIGTGRKAVPGWRLLVAIADVSHYVKPGEAIDTDAYERATSVYFPRRVIPMLPEKLSNGLCSLNPDVERLSMVCDMVVDADGIVTAYQFYAAVIRSQARLTYTEVAAALINSRGVEAQRLAAIMPQLRHLHDVYRALLKQRQVRGAIDFETTETQMICDAQGRIERIVPRTRNEAHRLIEEAMLAANVCAAEFIAVNTRLSLYRVHEGPTPEKKTTLQNYLRALGLGLSLSEDPRPAEYQAISQAVRGRPDAHQIQTMLLRSMQQAIYTPVNSGHFGLAYAAYTHFTSPIRRYPDLLVHRTIKAILQGKRLTLAGAGSGAAAQQASWEAAGLHCSTNERRADEASRDVESWLKCRYMRDRLGEEFDGTVSAATSFGLFVQLNTLYVEGLVHITELGGEYYRFDEVRQELRGERTGIRYGIGASVRVQVSRVDLDSRRIDFRLVRPSGEDDPAGVGRSLRRKSRDTRRPFGNTEDSTQAAPSPVEQLEAVQAQDRAARGKLKRAQTRLSELPRLAGGAKLGKAASGTAPTRAPKVAKKAAKRR